MKIPANVTVTTTVQINGQTETFTVHGVTERNPYRMARRLAETNQGDLDNWAVDLSVALETKEQQ